MGELLHWGDRAPQTADRQPRRPRLLVVEDDDIQRVVLTTVLNRLGCEVQASGNGLDAVWRILYRSFDLVLMDYNLPEINGFATAELIRYLMGDVARPRLIALTASPKRLRDLEGLHGTVFDDIIGKPDDLGELLTKVDRHLDALPDTATRHAVASTLPWNQRKARDVDAARPCNENKPRTSARILVVEDDELQQLVLRSALEFRGYHIDIVADGLQAIRMILGGAYDLVLVDYRIPEMDGLALGRLVLNLMDENRRPRMIALTSAPEHLTHREADSGSSFDEVIKKSSDLPALFAVVDRHLRASPHGDLTNH